MSRKSKGVWLRLDCFDLVTDLPTAVLLSQLAYWNEPDKDGKTKMRIYREGKRWVAKSHFEWWQECRLSRRQIDRAAERLLKLGLVEVKTFHWKGVPTRHLHLLSLHLQVQSTPPTGAIATPPTGAILYTETTKATENTTDKKTASEKISLAKATKTETEMKADEQLKKFNDKYHPDNGFPDTLQKKVNTRNLVSAWETMSAHYFDPIGKTKPLVSKEIGQITQFRKAVGNEDAYRVMKWVISNWSQFLFDITDNTGATLSLKQPHVGTLLKYWNVALAGCNKQSASPKKTGGVKMLSKEEKATT